MSNAPKTIRLKFYLNNGQLIKHNYLTHDPNGLKKIFQFIALKAVQNGSSFKNGWYKCSCHNVEESISPAARDFIHACERLMS